jgi:hypothetical protein
MTSGSHESRTEHLAQGPCHRCGWSVEVTKVSRARAKQLHFGRHAAQLCDECIGDLRGSEITRLGERPAASTVIARHRHRVA